MNDQRTLRPRPNHYLTGDGRVARSEPRSLFYRLFLAAVVLFLAGGLVAAAALVAFLSWAERTPREWAPYLMHRADGHRSIITDATGLVAHWLLAADRMVVTDPLPLPPALGAAEQRSGEMPKGRIRLVDSLPALSAAAAAAAPGDVIVLRPGTYKMTGWSPIKLERPGTAEAPITLRAARLGDVVIESQIVETLKVSEAHWRIENLVMRGTCGGHGDCEHAIHVVGSASDTVIRNNRFEDYNAHIKINGEGGKFPDGGAIDGNTFTETAPRQTQNPITPIDLVAASDWHVRGNVIADFVRGWPEGATYGVFVKGEGENNIVERNLVICEWKLRGVPGQHIGLSLGGGGTDMEFRRLSGRTGFEQVGGILRDNLVTNCSDDGIYLNRSARSVIDHNTLLDTAGIDVRFVESSATITNNIVDGAVRARDGGMIRGYDNDRPWLLQLFLGMHPQRAEFRDPAKLDLTWTQEPERLTDPDARNDLCGEQRRALAPRGAIDDFASCLRRE